METAVVLLTAVCYGLALYLWWLRGTPIFFFALIAGHIGALASPLRTILYGLAYSPDMEVLYETMNLRVLKPVFIASAWYYTLPALLMLYLYSSFRMWFSGYLMGVTTYVIFLFYHLLLETLAMQQQFWLYTGTLRMPLGLSHALFSALMAALISQALLYMLLLIFRSSRPSMIVVLLPAVLVFTLIVQGLFGAPFWIPQLLHAEVWMLHVGLVSTLLLLAIGIHTVSLGLARVNREIVV